VTEATTLTSLVMGRHRQGYVQVVVVPNGTSWDVAVRIDGSYSERRWADALANYWQKIIEAVIVQEEEGRE